MELRLPQPELMNYRSEIEDHFETPARRPKPYNIRCAHKLTYSRRSTLVPAKDTSHYAAVKGNPTNLLVPLSIKVPSTGPKHAEILFRRTSQFAV